MWNLLLQILEEGCLTDSQGRRVDFRNTVVAMTSNVGARAVTASVPLGFSAGEDPERRRERQVMSEVRRVFRPELLGRIDEIVVFRQLGREALAEIARRLLRETACRAAALGTCLEVTEELVDRIVAAAGDQGARPLRAAIRRQVEDPLAQELLERAGEQRLAAASSVSGAKPV